MVGQSHVGENGRYPAKWHPRSGSHLARARREPGRRRCTKRLEAETDCRPSARKGAPVTVEQVREIRAADQRVDLEGELGRIDLRPEMADFLRPVDRDR